MTLRQSTAMVQEIRPDSRKNLLPDILADLTQHLCDRYSFTSEDDAYLIAVWIVHCWLIAAFDKTVYLLVTAPDTDYGKTEIAKALRDLCPKARLVIHPTAASLSRFSLDGSDTLIIDEFDRTMRRNETDKQMLYQFADAGIDRGYDGYMLTGEDGSIVYRSTFGPKAYVGIQIPLDGTLLTRSIRIPARKGTESDQTEREARQVERPVKETARALHNRLSAYATDKMIADIKRMRMAVDSIRYRTLNDGHRLANRDAVNWIPLIIVGDIAGLEHGKRIRDIASRFTANGSAEPEIYANEAEQIDAALIQLIRKGRLPVHSYLGPKDPPIPLKHNGKLNMTNEDFGWPRDRKRPSDILPAITLLFNADKREAELRIQTSDIHVIAQAIGWTATHIKRAYSDANRLHAEKGRTDIKLHMYFGQDKPIRLVAIDFSNKVFGENYSSTDESIRIIERIISAETESEMWNADQ